MPRLPDLGLLAGDVARGPRRASSALSGWTKFAALIVAPLWADLPRAAAGPGRRCSSPAASSRDGGGVLGPAARAEPARTPPASSGTARSAGRSGATRRSRSGTGASTTPGLPDLHCSSRCSRRCSVAGALAAAFVPRRKSPLQLAALTGALLARLRDRPDALVLPLHALVLPLRRDCGAGADPGAGAAPAASRMSASSPGAGPGRSTEPARARWRPLGRALLLVSLGAAPRRLLPASPIVDTPSTSATASAMANGAGALPRLPARVPARLRCPCFVVPAAARRGAASRLPAGLRDGDARALRRLPRSLAMAATLAALGAGAASALRRERSASRRSRRSLLGSVVLSRFDLWPAALTVARARGARRRTGAARVRRCSGSGSRPSSTRPCSLPLALAWVWRRRGRRAGAPSCRRIRGRRSRPASCRSSCSRRTASGDSLGRQTPGRCRSRAWARRSCSPRTSSAVSRHVRHEPRLAEPRRRAAGRARPRRRPSSIAAACSGSGSAFARGPPQPERLVRYVGGRGDSRSSRSARCSRPSS